MHGDLQHTVSCPALNLSNKINTMQPKPTRRGYARESGIEACLGATAVWGEKQPHRRSARWINSGRRLSATQRSQLTTGARGPVVYLQHIVAIVGVESIKLQFRTVAAWYCDAPRTPLVVRIIPWVARTWERTRWCSKRGRATWNNNNYMMSIWRQPHPYRISVTDIF